MELCSREKANMGNCAQRIRSHTIHLYTDRSVEVVFKVVEYHIMNAEDNLMTKYATPYMLNTHNMTTL